MKMLLAFLCSGVAGICVFTVSFALLMPSFDGESPKSPLLFYLIASLWWVLAYFLTPALVLMVLAGLGLLKLWLCLLIPFAWAAFVYLAGEGGGSGNPSALARFLPVLLYALPGVTAGAVFWRLIVANGKYVSN